MASQWTLMWRKLQKHKLAKFSLIILAIQGPVLLEALKSQDMYLAGTSVLIQALLVLVGTLLSDIALAWLDPRIRFSERG